MRCLIVEDDQSSRALMMRYLEDYFDCDVAVDGEQAISVFEKSLEKDEPYDLICLDIMMPNMDGHQVLRKIRQLETSRDIVCSDGVKVVMTTALDDSLNVMSSFREGCEAYVTKPVKISKLFSELHKLNLLDTSVDWLNN